jgi:hypothetical protein
MEPVPDRNASMKINLALFCLRHLNLDAEAQRNYTYDGIILAYSIKIVASGIPCSHVRVVKTLSKSGSGQISPVSHHTRVYPKVSGLAV